VLGVLVQTWQLPMQRPADPLGFRMIIAPPRAAQAQSAPQKVPTGAAAPIATPAPVPVTPVRLSHARPPRPAVSPRMVASPPRPAAMAPMAAPRVEAVAAPGVAPRAEAGAGAPIARRSAAAPSAPDTQAEARATAPGTDLALGRLQTEISDAVRAASHMPEAAVRQHRQGRARVAFTYMDGFVQAASVAESSTSRLLDDAALLAVRTAQYPAPPPQARGHRLSMLVWIDFRIAPAG
jgi:TonB family protein